MEAGFLIALFIFGLLHLHDLTAAQEAINVNMNGNGCDNSDSFLVADNQIYSLYYDYAPHIQGSRDHCDVSLRASQANRRLRYYVITLDLLDCGVEIWVYFNPDVTVLPTRKLTCNDDKKLPIYETSTFTTLKFSLRKTTSQSNTIRILIKVTTDNGPDIDFVKGQSEFYEQALEPGAIAGIAIAGAIILVALIGLAIYCCIRNRREYIKNPEASGAASTSSVFTSGTSQNIFPANNKRSRGSYGSMEDVRSTTQSTEKNTSAYSNKGYKADTDEKAASTYSNKGYKTNPDEKKPNRQNSYPRREKNQGGHVNEAYEQSDVSADGTDAPRDSGRTQKYDKKKSYSRTDEYEMSKVNKMPINGILKTRSKSPNRSQSSTESSMDTTNAMVYGYSHGSSAHPNTQHVPVIERPRSRSRSGTRSTRSGSTGSQGRSSSAGRPASKDQKLVKTSRQYGDLSNFLDERSSKGHRPRSRSNSVNRKRSDSRASEKEVASDISFSSSKKTTGTSLNVSAVSNTRSRASYRAVQDDESTSATEQNEGFKSEPKKGSGIFFSAKVCEASSDVTSGSIPSSTAGKEDNHNRSNSPYFKQASKADADNKKYAASSSKGSNSDSDSQTSTSISKVSNDQDEKSASVHHNKGRKGKEEGRGVEAGGKNVKAEKKHAKAEKKHAKAEENGTCSTKTEQEEMFATQKLSSQDEKSQGGYISKVCETSEASGDSTDFSVSDPGHAQKQSEKRPDIQTEYEMSKVNRVPVSGILKTRSKSPNRLQSSVENAFNANALIYGYTHTTGAHPIAQHVPIIERTRSRSRSGSRSIRSSSTGSVSRSSSGGKAAGKDKKLHKTSRQYGDLSTFLDDRSSRGLRSRSLSSSAKRKRSESRSSDKDLASDISFTSKRSGGGKRVHIQGVESDI